MSKLSKFFIICGAVCVTGIILAAAGYAAGGVEDMNKVAEKHDWIVAGPEDRQTEIIETGEFDSIEVTGTMDILFVGPESGLDAGNHEPAFLEGEDLGKLSGSVVVNWGKKAEKPDITTKTGVLKIKGKEGLPKAQINLSGEDIFPDVVVFCNEGKIKSINVKDSVGDLEASGMRCGKMTIQSGAGDITIDRTYCKVISVATDAGDMEFTNCMGDISAATNAGDMLISFCDGNIDAETQAGDIEFETDRAQTRHALSLTCGAGEISVNEDTLSSHKFEAEGSPYTVTLTTDAGDIDTSFGDR